RSPSLSFCWAIRNCSAVSGHTSGQCVYRNASTTTLPRWAESVIGLPLIPSVRVKSGAAVGVICVPTSVGAAHDATRSAAIASRNAFMDRQYRGERTRRRGLRRHGAALALDLGRDQHPRRAGAAVSLPF